MRADQAKTIPVIAYLAYEGHQPIRTRQNGRELWYQSPIRKGERTASFKVDAALNKWYDHGLGEGGNTLDLAIAIHQATVRDALRILEKTGLFSPYAVPTLGRAAGRSVVGRAKDQRSLSHIGEVLEAKKAAIEKEKASRGETALKLVKAVDVRHPALLEYLAERKIDRAVAQIFLQEVHFTNGDGSKKFFALGWPVNESGSYEVRNKFFKGLVGPDKHISHLPNPENDVVVVFEGFFDFLAFMTYHGYTECPYGVIVLNSTALKAKAAAEILKARYKEVRLYLDNDAMGTTTTQYFESLLSTLTVHDERSEYSGFKDYNDKLMHP